jgi:hypothetical protein
MRLGALIISECEFSSRESNNLGETYGRVTNLDRYQHLDQQKKKIQDAKKNNPQQTFEKSLKARIEAFVAEDDMNWIYGNNIEKVWTEWVQMQL